MQVGSHYIHNTVYNNKEYGLFSTEQYEKVGRNHIVYNQTWEPFPSIIISIEKPRLFSQSVLSIHKLKASKVCVADIHRSHVISQPEGWWGVWVTQRHLGVSSRGTCKLEITVKGRRAGKSLDAVRGEGGGVGRGWR